MAIIKKKTAQHFRANKFIWKFLGVFKLNERQFWSFIMLFHIIIGIGFPLCLIISIGSFSSPLENITNFCMSVTSLATSLKFLCYVVKLDRLHQIERILKQLDNRVDGEEQILCFRQMGKRNRLIWNVFMIIYSTITVSTEISFVFRSERSLPFPAWFPLDWTESLINYSFALSFQVVGIFFLILENMVDDAFPPQALNLIAGHCKLLAIRISRTGYNSENQLENEKELINCIRDHEKVYRLLKLIMDIISWPMLIQFIVIAIDLGAATFTLIFYAKAAQDRIYFTFFLIGLNCQIFPVCYIGAQVDFEFDRLHYAIFCSNWVHQSYQYRKNVLVLAERTKQRPLILAGHIVPIHLTTFMANYKAAYSIYTLIGNTGEN